MKVWYDTEFLDDGKTVDLISIGMVREDGSELYLINKDFDLNKPSRKHWLIENVYPHLPVVQDYDTWYWDAYHEDTHRILPKLAFRSIVGSFLFQTDIELWAWFAAYDHLMLSQIYGRMLDLPRYIPQFTNDLMTLVTLHDIDVASLPAQTNHHKAIDDARWNRAVYNHIDEKVNR